MSSRIRTYVRVGLHSGDGLRNLKKQARRLALSPTASMAASQIPKRKIHKDDYQRLTSRTPYKPALAGICGGGEEQSSFLPRP